MTLPWLIGQFIESRGPHTMMPLLLMTQMGAILVLAIVAILSKRSGPVGMGA